MIIVSIKREAFRSVNYLFLRLFKYRLMKNEISAFEEIQSSQECKKPGTF